MLGTGEEAQALSASSHSPYGNNKNLPSWDRTNYELKLRYGETLEPILVLWYNMGAMTHAARA